MPPERGHLVEEVEEELRRRGAGGGGEARAAPDATGEQLAAALPSVTLGDSGMQEAGLQGWL